MADLAQWLAFAPTLDSIYQSELGRSAFSDPEAFVNWTYHWRESGHTASWIRDRIRESPEWRARHPMNGSPPAPALPPPVIPAPPGGGGVRLQVTNENDGPFVHRMYSYWSNAWVSGDWVYVFAGHVDGHPRFFKVQRSSGDVERLGALLHYISTSEGWYWSAEGEVYLCDGPRLLNINPFTGDDLVALDISGTHPGCRLWQAHSSDDGQVHSATVEQIVSDGPYPRLGTVISRQGRQMFYPAQGTLDESQVDPTGRYVVIKETFQRDKSRLDNRFLDLHTGADEWMRDEDGAFGHSDMGPGFIVGENDQIGACEWMDLRTHQRRTLFETWNMGHVSVRGGRCVLSDGERIALVGLDGSGVTPILAHGSREPTGANVDPSGRVVTYMVNGAVSLLLL